MGEVPQIIVPRPGGETKPYESPKEHWEQVCDEIYGSHDEVANTFHVHDPDWANHPFGIQNIADQNMFLFSLMTGKKTERNQTVGFWTVVGLVFALSQMAWIFGPVVLRRW